MLVAPEATPWPRVLAWRCAPPLVANRQFLTAGIFVILEPVAEMEDFDNMIRNEIMEDIQVVRATARRRIQRAQQNGTLEALHQTASSLTRIQMLGIETPPESENEEEQ